MRANGAGTDRRTVLQVAGAAALGVPLAGCTSVLSSDNGNDDVVLGLPENYEKRKELDLPYPTYGEALPAASVPAPLHDRELSTREFVGDRHTLLTFIYTSCQTVCPGLTAALRHVQADSIEEGYAGTFAFMPTTFDPEYDTADRLSEYGTEMGVDFEAGNWYFLRPETPSAARDVVEETFGVAFEKGQGGSDRGHDGRKGDHDAGAHGRLFTHSSLVLLVNRDGFVERAYNGGPPTPARIVEDARTVVDAW